jgi:hypothetical protein
MRRWLAAGLTLLALAACDDGGRSTLANPSFDRAVEREAYEFFTETGASKREATCLATTLTADADDLGDVFTMVNVNENPDEPFGPRAARCASSARLLEIAEESGIAAAVREASDVQRMFEEQFRSEFLAAGATQVEADCMVQAFFDLSTDPTDEVAQRRRLEQCGSPERLEEIFETSYRLPLVAAGATPDEARCIVDQVDNIDLFLPSEDWNGEFEAEQTAENFTKNAAECGSAERLTAIVFALFGLPTPSGS